MMMTIIAARADDLVKASVLPALGDAYNAIRRCFEQIAPPALKKEEQMIEIHGKRSREERVSNRQHLSNNDRFSE